MPRKDVVSLWVVISTVICTSNYSRICKIKNEFKLLKTKYEPVVNKDEDKHAVKTCCGSIAPSNLTSTLDTGEW
jgi:1,2-phenylacetyl-CoA epoxidase PaaB subunit